MMFFYCGKIGVGDIMNAFELSRVYEYYKMVTLQNNLLVLMSFNDFCQMTEDNEIIVSWEGDIVNGFILFGIVEKKAYLTLLYGTDSVKTDLLTKAESYLKDLEVTVFWVHFFNPTKLEWYPLDGVIHPTLQGVVLNSVDHEFLSKKGFKDYTIEETYYRGLKDFEVPSDVQKVFEMNLEKGYSIEFYDVKNHSGLDVFCQKLNAPHWKEVIDSNYNSVSPLPLLVATYKSEVVGFTGPLRREENGRGYFAGIGVLDEHRGNKLGKTLFLFSVS